jgi:copper homeostasis protein CutC
VTPSHGSIVRARDGLTIPLYVLIRPRSGDFVYDELELAAILDDIAHCRHRAARSSSDRRPDRRALLRLPSQ